MVCTRKLVFSQSSGGSIPDWGNAVNITGTFTCPKNGIVIYKTKLYTTPPGGDYSFLIYHNNVSYYGKELDPDWVVSYPVGAGDIIISSGGWNSIYIPYK